MKNTKELLLAGLILLTINVFSQDPNFHIYLCFGQSNMEGAGVIEAQDNTVSSRFKVLEAVDCSVLGRTVGNWYTATPPLCRCNTGLSPVDYFGRTMVEHLPDSIKIGVIQVAVGGCKIELFDKNNYQTYLSTVTDGWFKDIVNLYGGNPYGRLVDLAKKAQKAGVIKGILLHQGESNNSEADWPVKVKQVYDNLLADLGLAANSIPLLAGEVVNADQGGSCREMNAIIAKLPETISKAYVISSSKCTDGPDNLHFNSEGYRRFGTRYAIRMLNLMGIEAVEPPLPAYPETDNIFLEPECATTIGANWQKFTSSEASNGIYVTSRNNIESKNAAAGTDGTISLPFTVNTTGTFTLYARVNCPTANDDSFWIKMDNGDFSMSNGLSTNGWQWVVINTFELTKGQHTVHITYRENGALLDKICISNFANAPTDLGGVAINLGSGLNDVSFPAAAGYSLSQNVPNPFSNKTGISFEIPNFAFVSLKIYNLLGVEMKELAGKNFSAGKHTVEFNSDNLSAGNYFYTLKTGEFTSTKKMLLAIK
ncbi:MAG TPA: sialate O-acetylesterase [Paludibacter sp.]